MNIGDVVYNIKSKTYSLKIDKQIIICNGHVYQPYSYGYLICDSPRHSIIITNITD